MAEEFKDYPPQQPPSAFEEPYYPPPPEPEKERPEIGVIKELDPVKELNRIRHTLKGEFYNEEEKKWVKIGNPIMSDEGIGKYLCSLQSIISNTITFSNFTEQEIRDMLDITFTNLSTQIKIYYKDYGLKKSFFPTIDNQIFILAYACLKKAQSAGERNVIGRTIQEQIQTRTAMGGIPFQEKKRGFLSKISPF